MASATTSRVSSVLLLVVVVVSLVATTSSSRSDQWEEKFLAVPDPNTIRDHLQYYTSFPHIAGSQGDYDTAIYTQQKLIEYGITNTVIEEHEVLLTYPLKRIVEIVAPEEHRFVAKLKEPVVSVDPTSNDTRSVDTFNGYAPSGNVTAELVYANYGRLEDFQQLEEIGVNVTGKIVIVRYGQVFRGVKAMIAEQFGAVGVLIYSDPADDGYGRGDTYPEGPWRPEDGVQRGSVQFLSICAGNPLDSADCLPEGSNKNWTSLIPSIPVQPISWGDALPLLRAITNNNVTSWPGWTGGLNITYAAGPGPVEVHLETEIEFNVTTIWNVVGTIEGVDKDRSVLIGNHRDAWVFGATDPSSGSAVLLDIARGYGELLKQGWKPQRNIVLLSWDAEEYGLVGSTAYAKQHKDDLVKGAIAYLNIDVGVGGTSFKAGATPSLRYLIEGAAATVPYPGNTNQSILEHWGDDKVDVLGSGSDYTAFIHHLGITSLDTGFSGGLSAGVYHSIYDSFYWMDHFGDPGFVYHKGIAQFLGLVGLRLVDSVVLPFNFSNYADKLELYTGQVIALLNSTADAPDVHINALLETISSFAKIGDSVESEKTSQNLEDKQSVASLNDRIFLTERQFINPAGLTGRPFYKHVVQAPGLYSGYGADIFPGLLQAIREKNWEEAAQQADAITARVKAAAEALEGKTTPDNKKDHKVIIIVGSVVGGVVVVGAVIGAIFYFRHRKPKYVAV